MKLATSRVLLAFASCQILAFMPAVSAQGPYEELIAAIQAWVDARLAEPPPVLDAVPRDPDLLPTAPPNVQDLDPVRAILQKFGSWLELLQNLKTEQDRQPLSVAISQYKEIEETTKAARAIVQHLYSDKNLTLAGQQLGILYYVLHLIERQFPEPDTFLGHVRNAAIFENLLEVCPAARMLQQMLIYFDSIYKLQPKTLKLFKKGSGDQLGITAQFALGDGKMYKYRIKTHSSGRSSSAPTSGPGDVDPIELFVYSVLEAAGLGPEVHFFRYNTKDFYIATRDVGDNGTPNLFSVSTYDQLENDLGIKRTVFDWMEKLENPGTTWEALIGETPVVVRALVQSNVLAHILNLTDLNGGNTCFVHAADGSTITDYRIVDFRPNGIDESNYGKNSFSDFRERLPADGGNSYKSPEATDDRGLPMMNRVLGMKSDDWFLILARYRFPDKIFLAIDAAAKRIRPIVEALYPPTPHENKSEQSRLFEARVRWFRWKAKTFFEQLKEDCSGQLKKMGLEGLFDWFPTFPEKKKWTEAAKPTLGELRGSRVEPSVSGTPPRSPSIKGASIIASPSKAPGSPSESMLIEKARGPAMREIASVKSLIQKVLKSRADPSTKRVIEEEEEEEEEAAAAAAIDSAKQVINSVMDEARGVTDTGIIQDFVQRIKTAAAKVSEQKRILEEVIRKAPPAGKAAAAPKAIGGSKKSSFRQRKDAALPPEPPAETGAPSKSQREPTGGEGKRKAPNPETPERTGQSGAGGLRPSPEKPKGPPGSAKGNSYDEE
jgi:flagellum-specific peptidoglycan hydrolase FlgJ